MSPLSEDPNITRMRQMEHRGFDTGASIYDSSLGTQDITMGVFCDGADRRNWVMSILVVGCCWRTNCIKI